MLPNPIMTWYIETIVSVCPAVAVPLGWGTLLLPAAFLRPADEEV